MIRKVIVYTFGDQNQDNTIRTAARFAEQHGAELTGLFVRPDIMGYSSVYGEYPLNLAETFYDLQNDFAADAEKRFNEVVSGLDCNPEWHVIGEYERKPKPALYADFLFVSQPTKESSVIFNDTDYVDHLIMETGLPTVIVPADWDASKFAVHPVLGWKESKEAVGAVRHSLSLMRKSDAVDIVTATRTSDSDADLVNGIEISAYLAAHDINCKFFSSPMDEDERDESETLLRHAHDNNCDLIIIGGYGHSRFREIVLGGVTRGLIRNSDVPIVLSH